MQFFRIFVNVRHRNLRQIRTCCFLRTVHGDLFLRGAGGDEGVEVESIEKRHAYYVGFGSGGLDVGGEGKSEDEEDGEYGRFRVLLDGFFNVD